jgi:S-adenosylmethionine:tRNA ribosyltransferase-isomerase
VRLELFDYPLPPERIAQTPIEPRDASRLLVLHRDGSREHRRFRDFPSLLNPGDLLVFNDTRVLPARLFGRKETGARVEVLLLNRLAPGRWEGLAYPGRRLQEGARVRFGEDGELTGEVVGRGPEGTRVFQFDTGGSPEAADELLHRLGQVPLPPYIHTRLDDAERYQTIYARDEGSAAAPTAGLHFTPRVFEMLQERGVRTAFVTLHVGIATFRPVKVEEIEAHEMHAEWYSVPAETARAVNECPGRVIAVGTTTLRCLESAAAQGSGEGSGFRVQGSEAGEPVPHPSTLNTQHLTPRTGVTRLYITPGYRFRVADALLTNFHMPKSSLLILVSAFAGIEPIRAAYAEALEQGYRFLSFGDAMFIEGTTE